MAGLALGSKNELEYIDNDVDGDEPVEGEAEGDKSGNCDDQVSDNFEFFLSLMISTSYYNQV